MIYHLKSSRDFSFAIGRLYQAALLVDHANFTQSGADIYAATHFAKTNLVELNFDYSKKSIQREFDLVYGNYQF